ncbi:hypothetical protein BW733_01425 [Tessaracoccus flavescens]|uniref:Uncharacterized protein n=2 Tax=Tessaracoccus flavescens TaxID=399497 RepID=A0A1Q2D269_9ACTN|nr:hypothetical protein BW733_01425 [Tessaracoccus flavescens]
MIVGISAAAMAAGLGVGLGQLASADGTPTPSSSPSASTPASPSDAGGDSDPGERGGRGHRGGGGGVDTSALAEKLGVDESSLEEAVKAAREATRPEAPTEEGAKPTETERTAREEAFAKALASELELDEQKVVDAIEELRTQRDAQRATEAKEKLASAVTDGTLTQAEADAVQKALDEGIVSLRGGQGR